MPRVQFIGRVLPITAMVQITLPDLTWKWEDQNVNLVFRVRINHSFVNVECELERYDPTFNGELHKRAVDLARAAVNVVGFARGIGLSVYLETFIGPDGIPGAPLFYQPETDQLCTAYSLEPARSNDLVAIYNFVVTDPALFRAFNDLVEAITAPHAAPVNCGRVIDSIRRMITPDQNVRGNAAWAAMHAALSISRDYQQWISENATGPRHADPGYIPPVITHEMMRRCWAIMNRYLEYLKRDRTALTGPEFPLLTPPQP